MSTDKKRGGKFMMLFALLIRLGIGVGGFCFAHFYLTWGFWGSLLTGLWLMTGLSAVFNTRKKWNKEEGCYEEVQESSLFPVLDTIGIIGIIGITVALLFGWI